MEEKKSTKVKKILITNNTAHKYIVCGLELKPKSTKEMDTKTYSYYKKLNEFESKIARAVELKILTIS